MTAAITTMSNRTPLDTMKAGKACIPVACNDCGIYGICRETNGPDANLSALDTIVKERKLFKRGDLLYRAGEPRRSVFAIRCGSVKTYVMSEDGRVQVTGFHVTGELIGLDGMVDGHHRSEARALETTMVCEVPFDTLHAYASEIPTIGQQVIRVMSQEIFDNQELMLLLGKKSAEERLASFLLSLSQRFHKRRYSPSAFNLSMSRSDIGNYLGLAEETVCRLFTRFHDDGLLSAERRKVQLHDLGRLQAIAYG